MLKRELDSRLGSCWSHWLWQVNRVVKQLTVALKIATVVRNWVISIYEMTAALLGPRCNNPAAIRFDPGLRCLLGRAFRYER